MKTYSGGMRRRLDLAATLVARPEVLFLDEPTTGLDPRARIELWDVLETLVDEGATILLTTQYLEEADRLADDIVVVDHGNVIARGDARSLKRQVGGAQLFATVVDLERLDDVARPRGPHRRRRARRSTRSRGRSQAPTEAGPRAVSALADALADDGVEVEDIGLRQPTLDDVFLTLTGAAIVEARARGGGPMSIAVPAPAERRANPLTDIWVIARRGLLHMRRHPEALADVTLQPVMFTLLFAYVFGGAIQVADGGYREFLMGGIFAQTIVFGAFGVAITLAHDRTNGAIDRFRSLPLGNGAVLGGHAVASLLRSILPIMLMSICGLIVGWRINTAS